MIMFTASIYADVYVFAVKTDGSLRASYIVRDGDTPHPEPHCVVFYVTAEEYGKSGDGWEKWTKNNADKIQAAIDKRRMTEEVEGEITNTLKLQIIETKLSTEQSAERRKVLADIKSEIELTGR
jgi:hypothetical protein